MNPRCFAPFAGLAALLSALGASAEQARAPGCADLSLEPDPAFRGRFPDLLERIEHELRGRSDIDACARIRLQASDPLLIVVSVFLPDGRAASRTVTRRDDVLSSLQALLLVPEPSSAAPPGTSFPASPRAVERSSPDAPRRDGTARIGTLASRELGFELSVVSGVRVGDGQWGYGAGLLSFVEVKHWLLGFQGRADGYRSLVGTDPETALELSLMAGRRFDFGRVALDLTVGPAIALRGVTLSRTEAVTMMSGSGAAPKSPPPPERDGTHPMPRLILGARLGFRPRSVFRGFVGLDGELGPSDETSPDAPPSSARVPAFSIGLALGATVGTP